jgi:hypothetical protein
MRRLLAAVSVLVVGALAALPGATAAAAAPALPADLQVTASQASGRIGSSIEVRLSLRNNGPNLIVAETFQLVIEAPPGTRLGGGSALAGNCERSETTARCRYGFGLRRGERHVLRLGLVIQAQPSACGRVATNYAMDPRDRNNAANIRVTVGGQPRSCFVRTSPTPKASPTPKVTATPETEITEAPPDDAPASAEVLPALPADDDSTGGGLSMAGIMVIGGGLVLVALGGLLIWRLFRREPDGDEDDAGTGYAPTRRWDTGTAAYGTGYDSGPTYGGGTYGGGSYGSGPAYGGGPAQGGGPAYDGGTTQWQPGGDQPGQGWQGQRPPYPPDDTGPTYGR